jgi:hypothetical protein
MIRKVRIGFPACAQPLQRLAVSFLASAGEGRLDKIMRQQKNAL